MDFKNLREVELADFLEARSSLFWVLVASLGIVLVCVIDWASGPYLSTSIFYLLPIGLAAWYLNRQAGLILSVAGASAWLVTDLLTNPVSQQPFIPFWNAAVRLGFFIIVVLTLSSLRRSRQRQEDLMEFVVHDIRAPLGNMLTALDLLQENVGDPAEDVSGELVMMAKSSGRRILVLINSLLDLARLEKGKMPVQAADVPVADLFARAVAQIKLTAQRNRVEIQTGVEEGVKAVHADPELTERILINLLSNAIKFSPVDSLIILQAAPAPGNMVGVAIQDRGPGIPVRWQKEVFAKFGQVAARQSGAGVGSGLGLAFCKQAVMVQNGRIWLESNAGAGTTVHFTLPKA